MKKLIIIGAGGHGRVVADIAQKLNRYSEIAFLDDGDIKMCMGFPVIGTTTELKKYIGQADFFVAIGNTLVREKCIEELLAIGVNMPTLIHPSAIIGSCVQIGAGTVVMPGSVINSCSKLGKGVIVNTCSSIDHDCEIGDYVHIAVGAHLAGEVFVGKGTWIGAGAIVSNDVKICANCIIGAGAVVVRDITEGGTYIGVPAKKIR